MTDYLRKVHADGAVSRVHRIRIATRHWLFIQVNSGPPTWWVPRARLRKLSEDHPTPAVETEAMIGWIRICFGVTVLLKRDREEQ